MAPSTVLGMLTRKKAVLFVRIIGGGGGLKNGEIFDIIFKTSL
jgi:hypothetical protein